MDRLGQRKLRAFGPQRSGTLSAETLGCEYRKEVVKYLIDTHYRPVNRAMRRCHPRDLLVQVRNYCRYHDVPVEMRPEHFDKVVKSYFAMVLKQK